MANIPAQNENEKQHPLREIHPVYRTLGVLDDTLFALEKAFVTASLVIMTIAVFLRISHDFVAKQLLIIQHKTSTGSPTAAYLFLAALLLFAFVGGWVSAARSDDEHRVSFGRKLLAGAIGALVTLGFGILVTQASAPTIITILSASTGLILIVHTMRKQQASNEGIFEFRAIIAYVLYVLMVVGFIYAAKDFEGFSWTDSVALTLLLWMAFFGASMATYEKRHLAIDAIRKAIPTKYMRYFNAASYMVTAIATAALLYLSYIYFLDRLGGTAKPGRIPDSWKVLSIPVALFFVTIRFFLYSIGEWILGMKGIEPREQTSLQEVA